MGVGPIAGCHGRSSPIFLTGTGSCWTPRGLVSTRRVLPGRWSRHRCVPVPRTVSIAKISWMGGVSGPQSVVRPAVAVCGILRAHIPRRRCRWARRECPPRAGGRGRKLPQWPLSCVFTSSCHYPSDGRSRARMARARGLHPAERVGACVAPLPKGVLPLGLPKGAGRPGFCGGS